LYITFSLSRSIQARCSLSLFHCDKKLSKS